jgi:hypothetical protein
MRFDLKWLAVHFGFIGVALKGAQGQTIYKVNGGYK